jgi:uncharacterized repeat protein (TIGR01451 family)
MFSGVLGTAAAYAVLGASTVTNTGATAIVGDVGVSPGSAITGFPPGVISGGTTEANNASAVQAHADLATAYGVIAGEASVPANNLTGTDLGGLTLTPGVYHFNTAATLTGTLTLDAQGNPNARFDIQIGTTLITASNSAIVLINGAVDDNVYFQVGTSATLGSNTAFQGNILADQNVTLTTGASIGQGRAMAVVGAVTMDTNNVSATEADLSVTNVVSSGQVFAGNIISYTVTVANAGPNAAHTVALSDTLPANSTFVSDAQTSGPAFTLTNPAVGSTGTINGTISTLGSGNSATFTVMALVPANVASGTAIANTTSVSSSTDDPNLANNSQVSSTNAATKADVSLTNTAAVAVVAGNTLSYTIHVANAGPSDAQTVSMIDLIPANTTFVSETQTSGPSFSLSAPAVGGTGTISDTIGTLASGASANFNVVLQVSPSAISGASIVNTPGANASSTLDPSLANNTQSATTSVTTSADLSLTNVVSAATVAGGNTLSYTIHVANAGPSDAQTVAMSDLIPANTTFISDTQTSGPAFTLSTPAVGGTGTISNTIGTFASGASATFSVVVQVAPGTTNGASIVNSPAITAATTDASLANNSQSATTTVSDPAPTVTSVTPAQATLAGGTVVTITGTNLGGATAVDFGSTPITTFTSDSATQIVLVSPAGPGGTVDVTVVTHGGTSAVSLADQFTRVSAPTFTNLASAAFTAESANTFLFTTAGFPVPAVASSTLPAGLTFVDHQNGTATLSGTPTAAGLYSLTITAANGVSPNATQTFTLTVSTTPVIPTLTHLTISAPANNVTAGATLQFTPTGTDASGSPIALGQVTWSLDSGSVGSINQNGLFTAGSIGGTAVVRATSGGLTASQSITVSTVEPVTQLTRVASVKPVGNAQSITGFVVTFNGPLDPTTAGDVRGYQILRPYTIVDNRNLWQWLFSEHSKTSIGYAPCKLSTAVYDSQTDSVTLTLSSAVPVKKGVLVAEVMGTGAHAVLGGNGKAIDGDANGKAGGNYVDRLTMSVAKSVTYKTTTGEIVKLSLSGPGEILAMVPSSTRTPVIDLIGTDLAESVLTGKIRKGHNHLAYAVLDELNGTANASIELGTEFQVNQDNGAAAL